MKPEIAEAEMREAAAVRPCSRIRGSAVGAQCPEGQDLSLARAGIPGIDRATAITGAEETLVQRIARWRVTMPARMAQMLAGHRASAQDWCCALVGEGFRAVVGAGGG